MYLFLGYSDILEERNVENWGLNSFNLKLGESVAVLSKLIFSDFKAPFNLFR